MWRYHNNNVGETDQHIFAGDIQKMNENYKDIRHDIIFQTIPRHYSTHRGLDFNKIKCIVV